ncbi:hypothetical protein FBR05_12655 [Deltaproteobacteria bacterium PRO3]|nr:hypothetical protein [Deltaproteobacteria bacterium PRO3]
MAEREEARENNSFAVEVFAWIQAHGDSEVSVAAQNKLSMMRGEGSFGERAEGLLRRFAREAGDPAALLAMVAGGGVYRATKLATMARLSGGVGWFGRGAGLRFAGSFVGLAAEAPVFTTVARVGHGKEPFGAGWGEELKSAYLVLGGLKSMGGVSKRLSQDVENAKVKSLLAYGGMYGGIMTGHGLETAIGLREWRIGGTEWIEGLATLLQFKVSGDLLARAGGMRRREIEIKWTIAEENLFAGLPRAANDGAYPPIEPAANGPHRRAVEQTWALAAVGEHWNVTEGPEPTGPARFSVLASQGEDSGGGGGPKSKTGVKSRTGRRTSRDPVSPRSETATGDEESARVIQRAGEGEAKALAKLFSQPQPPRVLLHFNSRLESAAPEVSGKILPYLREADLREAERVYHQQPWLVINLMTSLAGLGHPRAKKLLPDMLKPKDLSWTDEGELRRAQREAYWAKRDPSLSLAKEGGKAKGARTKQAAKRQRSPSRKRRTPEEMADEAARSESQRQKVRRVAKSGSREKNEAASLPRDEASSAGSLEGLAVSESKGSQARYSDREIRAAYAQLNSMLKGQLTVNPSLLLEAEGILRGFFEARQMNQFTVEGVAVTEMVEALKSGMGAGGELGAACERILAADRVLGPYLAIRKHRPQGLTESEEPSGIKDER